MSLRDTLIAEKQNIMNKDILSNEDHDILDKIDFKLMDMSEVNILEIGDMLDNIIVEEEQRKEDNKGMSRDNQILADTKKFNYDVAKVFLKEMPIKTVADNKEIYTYNEDKGIWNNNGEERISTLCGKHMNKYATSMTMREVFGHIMRNTYIDRAEFNSDPTKVVLANGVLDLVTLEIYPHSKNYLYNIALPVKYDPEADCPKFKALIQEKMINDNDRKTLQEYCGFCLLNDMRYQKALMLYGVKRAGKSTVLHVISKVIGEENMTNMSLQYLNENNFALAYIYGKKANICADLPTEALRSISKFMLITGEDRVTADKKNQHPISFYSIAKLIFSCNQIPRIPIQEDAFYRRWIILHFPHETSVDKVNPEFKNELTTDAELSGVLNWMIEGARRLLTQNSIFYDKTDDDVKEIWRKNSDSIESFILRKIKIDDNEKVLKREIYDAYREYCLKNKLRVENHIKFGRLFLALTGCGTTKKNNIPAYAGAILKDGEIMTLKNYEKGEEVVN